MPGRRADLGELETLVMLAVLRLKHDASARTIREEVESTGGRPISRGALYATVTRMERKGLLSVAVREPTAGGRASQHFDVTPEGLESLRAAQQRLDRMRSGLETILDLSS